MAAKDTLAINTGNGNPQIPAKIRIDGKKIQLVDPTNNEILAVNKETNGVFKWEIKNRFRNAWNTATGSNLDSVEFANQIASGEIGNFGGNVNNAIDTYVNEQIDANTLDKYISEGYQFGNTSDGTSARKDQTTEASDDENGGSQDAAGGGGIDALSNLADEEGTPATNTVEKLITYPVGMSKDMDKLKITIKEYKPSKIDSESFDVNSADRNTGEVISTIFLPIPGGISDQNQVSWGKGDMNAMEIAMADFALSTIGAAAGDGNVVESAKQSAQRIANKITSGAGEGAAAIANILAGAATGIGNQQLLQRTGGRIINPNAELLFNGPSLRQFGFNFILSARSVNETKTIRALIRALKVGMAVRKSKTGLFLLSPHLFQLEYVTGNDESTEINKFINKFKLCALTGMQVNYTPNGTYMTYENKSPTSYGLDLQFQEIEPIYASDYDDKNSIGY